VCIEHKIEIHDKQSEPAYYSLLCNQTDEDHKVVWIFFNKLEYDALVRYIYFTV
jgi:hypothetical protein